MEGISHFSNNPPKLLSHLLILIKKEISFYGQLSINKSIINSDNYQLNKLDYDKFVKDLLKDFNERILYKKLDVIFIEFQAENEGILKDNNKNVIKYIRNNPSYELAANENLDYTFSDLLDLFNKNHLDAYLKNTEKVLETINKKKSFSKDIIESKIKAMTDIIETLCINYKEYFSLIDERTKNRSSH